MIKWFCAHGKIFLLNLSYICCQNSSIELKSQNRNEFKGRDIGIVPSSECQFQSEIRYEPLTGGSGGVFSAY